MTVKIEAKVRLNEVTESWRLSVTPDLFSSSHWNGIPLNVGFLSEPEYGFATLREALEALVLKSADVGVDFMTVTIERPE